MRKAVGPAHQYQENRFLVSTKNQMVARRPRRASLTKYPLLVKKNICLSSVYNCFFSLH